MKRILFFAVVLLIFIGAWLHFQKVSCKMVGLSSALGPIQSVLEAPFFSNISQRSNTSLSCEYVSVNKQGINGANLLQYLQRGFYDLVAIIFRQAENTEIAIAGMDMPGLPINLASSKVLSREFLPFLDKIFEDKYQAKIIATFGFGPLELFCSKPVKNLDDLKGVKIRISATQESTIFKLLTALDAKPISIEFGESLNAFKGQFVDCGIASYKSAESAGWFEYLPYRMDLNLGSLTGAYVINLKTWRALNARQKAALINSTTQLTDSMWVYSGKAYEQSQLPCSHGDLSCTNRPKLITLSKSDIQRLNQISVNKVLRPWLKSCEEAHAGCKSIWLDGAKKSPGLLNLDLSDL